MNTGTITRAAFGSTATLGDLYDARRDDFCGISIFKKAIPDAARTVTDSHFSDIHLVHSDDFSEKVYTLDVSAELQVSVLAGLFGLEGSGRYLNDQKRSARTVKSFLIYNIKTKQESVNISHEDLKDAFAIDAIESGIATHVVAAISWGANSIVTSEYENRENRDVREISGSLSAHMQKLSLSISGKASVKFDDADNSKGIKFDVRMFGDILSNNEELRTTFEGALNLMKKLPKLVATSNEGRGKPLSYRLIPLSLLRKYLNFSIQADTTLKTLEESSLVRVVQLFDQMSRAQQQLNDFYQDAIDFKYCAKADDLEKIATIKDEMAVQETRFRSELSTVLTNIRSGYAEVSKLEDLIQSFQSSNVAPQKVTQVLSRWGDVIERMNFARTLVHGGAKFIGFGESLDEEILKNFDSKSFIFYFSQKSKLEDPEKWGGNRQLFFQEMKKQNENHRYYVVDCDIHQNHGVKLSSGSSCIQIMQSGQVIVQDLLSEQKKISQTCFAQAICISQRILYKPTKRAPLTMPCPGTNCNQIRTYDWTCRKCMEKFEYGFDEHVYCNCGKTPAVGLDFRCNDPKHGLAYLRHEEKFLGEILATLRPFSGMNILVLGGHEENGIHNWINGMIGFFTYESFEAAEKPTTVTTNQNESNPDMEDSESVRIYPCKSAENAIQFIHIPFDQTAFSKLSHLQEIHGVCILLDMNTDTKTNLRPIIQLLITNLGENVIKNISFCIPVPTGNHRRAQETILKLRELLLENRELEMSLSGNSVYYFDTEIQKFLAELNQKEDSADITDERKEKMRSLWKSTASEARRLLKHIANLEPMPIIGGITLNTACELIEKMAQPLVLTMVWFYTNIWNFEKQKRDVEKTLDTFQNKNKNEPSSSESQVINYALQETINLQTADIRDYLFELNAVDLVAIKLGFFLNLNNRACRGASSEFSEYPFSQNDMSALGHRTNEQALAKIKSLYVSKKVDFEYSLMRDATTIAPEEISILVDELQSLHICGKIVKKALAGVEPPVVSPCKSAFGIDYAQLITRGINFLFK